MTQGGLSDLHTSRPPPLTFSFISSIYLSAYAASIFKGMPFPIQPALPEHLPAARYCENTRKIPPTLTKSCPWDKVDRKAKEQLKKK